MTFLEIIRNPITNLPIEQLPGQTYRDTVKQKLEAFLSIISTSDDLSGPVNGIDFATGDIFKARSKIIIDGIIAVIDAYYEGNINKAYNILSAFMKKSNLGNYLDKNSTLDTKTNLYRIRAVEGNYPLSKTELFHIPFQLRGCVATQRYSIPGLPSLYLSNSIFVAWEELRRPGFNKIQAMRLSNVRPLVLLDLTNDIYSRNIHLIGNEDYGWELLYKVMIWPLIAACSIKVKNVNDTFKPEYIIPQLLLQWVNKNNVDGIKYSSTHVDLNKSYHEGTFYNIVLPVKTFDQEGGYCNKLVDLFRVTEVLPMQLRQFISQSNRLDGQESISATVNPDISCLEVIKNNPQQYCNTYFGILEHSLNALSLETLS